MQWLIKLLQRRRLAVAIGIILLMVLVWVVGWWWLSLSPTVCIGITFGLLVIWISLLMLERRAAERGARQIEQSIKALGEEEVAGVRPDKREEVELVRRQLTSAIESLKKSKLAKGKSGRAALYALPWYMIIGPPAAGKTTAIKNSGLEFPFGMDHEIQGVGGTRNCDWWFSSSAILLDTAGRYMTEEDDKPEWLAFLDILKRHRHKQPVNGVLVGISIADLINAGADELEMHAKHIRKRIDELIQRLGVRFPVYLVFTKCDLLNGFVEFFEDFSRVQRGQVWGCTLTPEQQKDPHPRTVFEKEFMTLCDTLMNVRLTRLSSSMKRENRRLVYAFPLQLLAAKENLAQFVGNLLQPNPYQESPFFRGFYFTSGTQEGVPIDRVLQSIATSFGLPQEMIEQFNPEMKTKSYFIKELFTDIIIPDEPLVRLTSRSARQRRLLRLGVLTVSVLALIIFMFGVFQAYVSSGNVLENVAKDVAYEPGTGADSARSMERLNLLLGRLQDLEDAPLFSFGMDRRSTVLPAVRRLYLRQFMPFVRAQIFDVEADRLRNPAGQRGQAYDDLKTYLLLSAEHERLRENQDYQRYLAAQLPKFLDPAATALMKDHWEYFTKTYGDAIADSLIAPLSMDKNVVAAARATAGRMDVVDVYARLRARPGDLEPYSVAASGFHSLYSVPGLFTKAGAENIEKLIEEELTDPGTEAAWVLHIEEGQLAGPAMEKDRLAAALRGLYFQEYTSEWWKFLEALTVDPFDDIGTASVRLKELSDATNSPLRKTLEEVTRQTTFESAATAEMLQKAGTAGRALAPQHPVDNQFKMFHAFVTGVPGQTTATPLATVMGQFTLLGNAFEALKLGQPKGVRAYAADVITGKKSELLDALNSARQFLTTVDEPARKGLRPVCEQPVLLAWKALLVSVQGYLNEQWTKAVLDPYKQLADLYPFDVKSSYDTPLGTLESMFSGEGTLRKFLAEDLQPFASEEDGWSPVTREGQGIEISDAARDAIRNAVFVSKAFFRGATMGVRMVVRFDRPILTGDPPDFDRVCLTIGDKERCVKWKEEKSVSEEFEWPGQQAGRGASIKIINDRFLLGEKAVDMRTANGTWGIFRLLSQAVTSKGNSPTETRFSWFFANGTIIIPCAVSCQSMDNPLSRPLALKIPARLN